MNTADRIEVVRTNVAQACLDAGRDPSEVSILGACKTMPVERIREALDAGQILLAENRAQELRDKAPLLAAHDPSPLWHFIGRLQRNKVKYVVRWASLIHTVDSLALAEEIARRAPSPMGILIQVNAGGDAAKGGVAPADALDLCRTAHGLEGISVEGLMTMPPMTEDPEDCAPFFAEVADLAARGRADGLPLNTVSMGMSRDHRVAIREGATIIRLGTAIFGPRD